MSQIVRYKIQVQGIVQGVGFRPFVYRLAAGLNIKGWIANTAKGVEIQAEGQPDMIRDFIDQIKTGAPPLSKITKIDKETIPVLNDTEFIIRSSYSDQQTSTLISPDIHRDFCLPYDKTMHQALHQHGFYVSYHTCGGTLGIEEYIIQNECDASETLAPPSVGGNQEPWDFKNKIGNRIACIGGLDQFNVLTAGSKKQIRDKVSELFEKVGKEGGYICSASDHFFETDPLNLIEMARTAKECKY